MKNGWSYLLHEFSVILVRWFAFSLILPLTPLLVAYIETDSSSSLFSFIYKDKEIFIISIVLCGEAIGESLTASDKIPSIVKLMAGASAFVLSVFACLLYQDLANAIHPEIVREVAPIIFLGALIISASSQTLKILERPSTLQ